MSQPPAAVRCIIFEPNSFGHVPAFTRIVSFTLSTPIDRYRLALDCHFGDLATCLARLGLV